MPNFGELLGAEILNERESKGWTQVDLALKAFNDEDSVRRIYNYERGKIANPQARTYQPLCDALGITRARINDLKADASNTDTLNDDEVATLRAEKGSLETALANLQALTRQQLVALADLFDHTDPHDATDGALIEFLTEKARDYRALKAEVDAIEDGLKRLSNLKSAAQGAIAAGDLEEVEEILSRVQEVELDEAAKTAELRATNALLRGRTDQAFRILSAAADSFAAIDPLHPIERRLAWEDLFYAHGLRYGSDGMIHAAQMNRDALNLTDRETHPRLWGRAQNNLAIALRYQGSRTDGPAGADLLAQAVAACREALTIRTRDAHPVDWAMTQNNLAIALQNQGSRTDGPAGADLLAQAVTAYREALTIRTRDAHPVDWAQTQNNLANALSMQGSRTDGPAGADLLAQAVTAYRDALTIRTRDAHPVHWAQTQNNLAIALRNQGSRTDGHAGADLLAQAVTAYRDALTIRTRDAHPVQWADTQNNLAAALSEQGSRTDGPAGADLLAQAVAAYRAALTIRTRDAHPVQWAMTQENIALAEKAQADLDSCPDPRPHLDAALTHVTAALEIYDPVHMPYDYGTATKLKTDIEAEIAALDTP